MSVIRDRRKIEDTVCEAIIFRDVTHRGKMFARVDDVPEQSPTSRVTLDPPPGNSTRLNTFNRDLRSSEICDLGPESWPDSVSRLPSAFLPPEPVHGLWNEINVRGISRSARDIIGSPGRVTTDRASISNELKTTLGAANV